VANLDETGGQDVEQEPPDEFVGLQRDGPAALGSKANAIVIEGNQALVGDADAVGIAAQIAEDLLGSAKGGLGVDVPVDVIERVE
jgi:hypothetical protein